MSRPGHLKIVCASLAAALLASASVWAQDYLRSLTPIHPAPMAQSLAPELDLILQGILSLEQRDEVEASLKSQLDIPLDYGVRPRSVRSVLANPLSTLPATVMGRQSFGNVDDVLTLYAYEFDVDDQCDLPPLPMPLSIEEAANQIEAHAAQVTQAMAERWSDRDRRWLQENWREAFAVLRAQPHTSDLGRSERRLLRRFYGRLDSADRSIMLCEARRWLQFAFKPWRDTLRELLRASPRFEESIIYRRATDYGEIRFAGAQSQNHQLDELLFLADVAGDDVHGVEGQLPFTGLPQFVVDFAGNDEFEATLPGGLGSSLGSVSVLIDYGGDENYDNEALGQGAAIAGVGFIWDLAGDDDYRSVAMSQAAGLFGVGVLIDPMGKDRYSSRLLSQGVGMATGLGVVIEELGRDRYIAKGEIPTDYGTPGLSDSWSQGVGVGQRGLAAGGVGLLLDRQGSDRYDGSSFSQGGGYYFGFGALWDLGRVGDEYLGARYSFGWGAHAGVAHFHEAGGSDRFRSRQIVAAGPAWDHSVVFFEDLKGNDKFEMGEFSLGAAAYRSLAIFVDSGGADRYRRSGPQAALDGQPNMALFVDLGSEQDSLNGEPLPPGCERTPEVGLLCDVFDFNALQRDLPAVDGGQDNQ